MTSLNYSIPYIIYIYGKWTEWTTIFSTQEMKKKQTLMFVNLVNSDKSGIVASIDSSVKLAKPKDRDSTSYNRVTKFSSDCVKTSVI